MSSRIERCLHVLRQRQEGAFMPFLVVGDPDLETTLALSDALVRAGADLIEFGFPFSDPPADGPVIQAADERALASGTTPRLAFDLIGQVRARCETPIVLLMYYNLVLQYGVEAFYARAAEVGVDGILVADLPVEHARRASEAATCCGIDPIYIVSALTSDARAAKLSAAGRGFSYLVARIGITGVQDELSEALPGTIARLRRRVTLPLLAGFGISTP
ncbi:MAG: tryptophan synthase subunit alpha, partial [Polyangiaceae bacterium]|nr:tryptophan synthase subunit alpha [Polyangiaceae bacterium]